MNIVKLNEYLQKRLSGDSVISAASLFGISAISMTSGNFDVLVINRKEFSLFKYRVVDQKFYIYDYQEAIPHTIMGAISEELFHDVNVQRWWSHVFFNQTYDKFYDDLRIAEHCETTFKELISRVTTAIDSLNLPALSDHVFLAGEISSCPVLRSILRTKTSCPLSDLPRIPDGEIRENDFVVLPTERLAQHTLNINKSLQFTSITSAPISITLPLLSKGSDMTTGIKWEEMLNDQQRDYSVGNFDFKFIKVQVECDAFQNIFLLCQDINGNRIVKHIM